MKRCWPGDALETESSAAFIQHREPKLLFSASLSSQERARSYREGSELWGGLLGAFLGFGLTAQGFLRGKVLVLVLRQCPGVIFGTRRKPGDVPAGQNKVVLWFRVPNLCI